MKKEFKIVICGGGSTYTAGIVKNLLEEEELKIKELWLYDIDQERQEKVSLIVKEVVKDLRPSLELKISTDEEEAFTDADFIMAQMRVGGLKMRVKDEQISLKHGCIGQETCGAGGMAYGMRTIGPMVHLIDVCEKYASKTYWIVNYSNPAAIVAKATQTLRPNARILNICDMPVEVEARMAEILDTDLSNLEVDPAEMDLCYASAAGRGFAQSGGVAKAVADKIKEWRPDMEVKIASAQGLADCKKLLMLAKAGKYNGYLLEGMGCPGGCIGGAGTIADPVRTAAVLNKYVKDAEFTDPEQSAFMSNIHMLKDDPNFEV